MAIIGIFSEVGIPIFNQVKKSCDYRRYNKSTFFDEKKIVTVMGRSLFVGLMKKKGKTISKLQEESGWEDFFAVNMR